MGACFFGNMECTGLKHSGDNLTGEGNGDDEVILVNLEAVPKWVAQIFFTVNIYSKGVTFEKVANPYCRILDSSGQELARYELKEAGRQNGLIIARMFREDGGARWGFQAIGTFCRGQTWKDSLPDIVPIFRKAPRELQQRGASCTTLGEAGGGGGGGDGFAQPPQPAAA